MAEVKGDRFMTVLLVAILLIIATGVGAYLWTPKIGDTPASIAVTAPTRGETWLTGSSHTVTWASASVPSSNKVSISIRRVPPPSLQTEGQEFDPLVQVNLPNSGSYEWQISDMYPPGTYVLGLSAYESTPVTNPITAESAPFAIVPPLAADLNPLYGRAEWNAPHLVALDIPNGPLYGTGVEAVAATNTMTPSTAFVPFDKYYTDQLLNAGWVMDNSLAAGGPGRGQTVYRKGNEFIAVNFWTDFHNVSPDRPAQCPCDVTLKLFSTHIK